MTSCIAVSAIPWSDARGWRWLIEQTGTCVYGLFAKGIL